MKRFYSNACKTGKIQKIGGCGKFLRFLSFLLTFLCWLIYPSFSQIPSFPLNVFGTSSVNLDGDRAVVSDDQYIYIFDYNGMDWQPTDTLDVPHGIKITWYHSINIAVSGNRIVVTADEYLQVHEFNGSAWILTADFTLPEGFSHQGHYLGFYEDNKNLDIEGDRIVAGVIEYIGGDYHEDEFTDYFSYIYVYEYNGSTWELNHQIDVNYMVDDYPQIIGGSMALSGNRLLVNIFYIADVERAYLYEFNGTTWEKTTEFDNESEEFKEEYESFAKSVDIEGDRVIINSRSGFCRVYEFDGSKWILTAKLTPGNAKTGTYYEPSGYFASLSGDLVAFGGTNIFYGRENQLAVFQYDGSNWHKLTLIKGLAAQVRLSGTRMIVNSTTTNIYKLDAITNPEPVKIKASDGKKNASFGRSAAIWTDTAIVGAPFDREKGYNAGAAYIYTKNGTSWDEVIKLTASDASIADRFGTAVAIFENYAVVGAPRDDDRGKDAGAAYLFWFDGTRWIEQIKLTAPDGKAKDRFGTSVSIINISNYPSDIYFIAVGSPHDNYGRFSNAGSVYIFDSLGNEIHKLIPNDPKSGDKFGTSVAVTATVACNPRSIGHTLVVGAPYDDDKGKDSGSIYIFSFDDIFGKEGESLKLTASDGNRFDHFGTQVSAGNNDIIVGAPMDDDAGNASGSAYIFSTDPCRYTWKEAAKLTASDAFAYDLFGHSVAIDSKIAVVGAPFADHSGGNNTGTAYTYAFEDEQWVEKGKLTAQASKGDLLGFSVDIYENQLIAGAHHDDIRKHGDNSGAAYIYEIFNFPDFPAASSLARSNSQEEKEDLKQSTEDQVKSIKNPLVGIKEIKIYPNPFTEQISIELDLENQEPVEIMLLDPLGRIVCKKQFTTEESNQRIEVDLTKGDFIQAGIVYLGVKNSQGKSTWVRLVKR